MKTFTCKFKGRYLTGCAVVLADTPEEAAKLLNQELDASGLSDTLLPMDMIEFDERGTRILFDGDY